MHEENKRLEKRLGQLKREQADEQRRMAAVIAQAEEERKRLANQEEEMKDR